jgi:hypothetical protein
MALFLQSKEQAGRGGHNYGMKTANSLATCSKLPEIIPDIVAAKKKSKAISVTGRGGL